MKLFEKENGLKNYDDKTFQFAQLKSKLHFFNNNQDNGANYRDYDWILDTIMTKKFTMFSKTDHDATLQEWFSRLLRC